MQNTQTKVVTQHAVTIHPRSVKGRFRSFKSIVLVLAYAVYFILPWLPWSRPVGSSQAILFDLSEQKFYIFDLVVHANEIFWLAALLFLAAVLLFFSTALLGRVFCGYFCFQTLWTDAFRWIEKTIQGDRVKRIRLDKQSWGVEKILKRGGTHLAWLVMAFWTGLTFVLYYAYAPQLVVDFFTGQAVNAAYIATFVLFVTTYLTGGLMREKVCQHVCPYARFQSVMIDKDTLVPTYDYKRGEGSEGRAKPIKVLKSLEQRQEKGVGDCVDCGLCVQVCPVGIDIREGMQYDCIQCGLCVDACDTIMDVRGWDRGLIRYESENGLDKGKTHFFKLRTYGYGLAIIGSLLFLFLSLSGQKMIDGSIHQVRSPLYVRLSDGRIQNRYELKLHNKTMYQAKFTVAIDGLENAELDMGRIESFDLKPDEIQVLMAKVRKVVSADDKDNIDLQFIFTPTEGKSKEPIMLNSQFIAR
ncbi:MAG: cytochrome c oxidase accessory protein CcoG [Thiotrichaceae bacterium]|nr:cytochrome c oxidase accessory protein CcoG [Thiotrichaceae bacterium]